MFEGCDGRVCDAWSLQSSICLLPSFVCCLSRLLNIKLCSGLIFVIKGAETGGGGEKPSGPSDTREILPRTEGTSPKVTAIDCFENQSLTKKNMSSALSTAAPCVFIIHCFSFFSSSTLAQFHSSSINPHVSGHSLRQRSDTCDRPHSPRGSHTVLDVGTQSDSPS